MGYSLAAAAAISLITSYMAYSANREAADKQMALMEGVFDEIDRLEVPDVKKQENASFNFQIKKNHLRRDFIVSE